MLGDAVLHDLRAVPDGPQVLVDLVYEARAPVPHLARDGERAHRRPLVERLQPGGTIGVAEHLGPDLPGAHPARPAIASSTFRKSVTIASLPVRNDGNSSVPPSHLASFLKRERSRVVRRYRHRAYGRGLCNSICRKNGARGFDPRIACR